jgi:hypothetical protein
MRNPPNKRARAFGRDERAPFWKLSTDLEVHGDNLLIPNLHKAVRGASE